jgi:hypothetical protein
MPPKGAISVEMIALVDADDGRIRPPWPPDRSGVVNLNNLLQFEKIGPKS